MKNTIKKLVVAFFIGFTAITGVWAGLESATYISDLNTSNPTSGDPVSQADDHIRLVKSALQNTFPNVTGAVTATHTELNGGTWTAQTWQDMSASRALATVYTNSTGRPIMVAASILLSTSNAATVLVTIGAVQFAGTTASAASHASGITFIVPPGASYRVDSSGGTASVFKWAELR